MPSKVRARKDQGQRNRVVHWQIQPADEVREIRMAADGLEVRVSVKWA